MSGSWRPYVIGIRDSIALSKLSKEDRTTFHELVTAGEYELLRQRKDSYTQEESDELLRSLKSYYGYQGNLVNDPQYLADLQDVYRTAFKQLVGRDITPFRPVGPSEMMDRNHANMEWSSTALFYVPSPEEDVILCEYDCRNRQVSHFRDKNTLEEIGGRNSWDGDEKIDENTPWHVVIFEYDRTKQKEAGHRAWQHRITWACNDLNLTMVELLKMIADRHPGTDTAEKRQLTKMLRDIIRVYGKTDVATLGKMMKDLGNFYHTIDQYCYDSKRIKFVHEKMEIPETERNFAWKLWHAVCKMDEIARAAGTDIVTNLIPPFEYKGVDEDTTIQQSTCNYEYNAPQLNYADGEDPVVGETLEF